MMLVGQYMVYRAALDYIGDEKPLYIAISEADHQTMFEHPLGQQVITQMPAQTLPFVIYDPIEEIILRWMPPL